MDCKDHSDIYDFCPHCEIATLNAEVAKLRRLNCACEWDDNDKVLAVVCKAHGGIMAAKDAQIATLTAKLEAATKAMEKMKLAGDDLHARSSAYVGNVANLAQYMDASDEEADEDFDLEMRENYTALMRAQHQWEKASKRVEILREVGHE